MNGFLDNIHISHRRKLIKIIVILAGAVLVAGAVVVLPVQLEYRKQKARYINGGLPFNADDFARKILPEKNAAVLIEQLADYKMLTDYDFLIQDAYSLHVVEAHLDSVSPNLDFVVKASKLPHLYWNDDWSEGDQMLTSNRVILRRLCIDLAMRADYKCRKGDLVGALIDFGAVCRFAVLSQQDSIKHHVVNFDNLFTGAADLGLDLASKQLENTAFLQSISDHLDVLEGSLDFKGVIASEGYISIWHLRNSAQIGPWSNFVQFGGPQEDFGEHYGKNVKFRGSGDVRGFLPMLAASKTLKLYSELNEIYEQSPRTDTRFRSLKSRCFATISDNSMTNRFAAEEAKDVVSMITFHLSTLAYLQASRVALRLKIKQILSGERSRAQAIADIDDPYTGGALKSGWLGDILRVWSVGEDGADDGGNSSQGYFYGPAPDILVSLPRVRPVRSRTNGP